MDRINIQISPYKMKSSLKVLLIIGGLLIAGFAIFRAFYVYHWSNFVLAPIGLTLVIQGLGLNLLGGSKKLFLVVNDSKIEYNFGNIGRPNLIIINDLNSISFNDEIQRVDFKLNNGQVKELFLRMIPKDKRNDVMEELNRISIKTDIKNKTV
ncbi:MAG: hypothetical protein ABIP95_08760 [Pelobium sp.]